MRVDIKRGWSGPRPGKDKSRSYGFSYLIRSRPPASVHDSITQWIDAQGGTIIQDGERRIVALHRDPWAWGLRGWLSSKRISIRLQESNGGTRIRAIIRTSHRRRTYNREDRQDYDEWLAFGLLMENMMSQVDKGVHKRDRRLLELAEERERDGIRDGRAIMATCGLCLLLSSFLAYQAVAVWPIHRSTQAGIVAVICEVVIIASVGFFCWGWTFYAGGARIRKYVSENERILDAFAPS